MTSLPIEGQIFRDGNVIVIDAEPQVMSRIRFMFPSAKPYQKLIQKLGHIEIQSGEFTHKPIQLSISNRNLKEIDWVTKRFFFRMSNEVAELLSEGAKRYDEIITSSSVYDSNFIYEDNFLELSEEVEIREYQVQWDNHIKKVKRALNADGLGLGKTFQGALSFANPENRPGLAVVQTNLLTQWDKRLNQYFKNIKTHIIKTGTYELPKADVYIIPYSRLSKWEDQLVGYCKSVVFDEIQELRHGNTDKYSAAKAISHNAKISEGLSATPIFNYGAEIWNIFNILKPESELGTAEEFRREWCGSGFSVLEPSVLNKFLIKHGLMVRRESKDVGFKTDNHAKVPVLIDASLEELRNIQDVMKILAIKTLSNIVGESEVSSKELDYKLRHATGVAKARAISQFARQVLEEESKVAISLWHRDVYDIIMEELKEFNPVMYTGSETPNQKDASYEQFLKGDSRVLLISNRSVAGIDGLQEVCKTAIIGELDWAPQVHNQFIGRFDRPGQKDFVTAYYLYINDGSDPVLLETQGIKNDQHKGIIEGKDSQDSTVVDNQASKDRIKKMAQRYLESIGEEIPVAVEESGLLKETAEALRKMSLPRNSEKEMQDGINKLIHTMGINGKIEKEFKFGKRNRLDFYVHNDSERIAVECKKESINRAAVYKQVRRYIKECNVTSVIIVAPWTGVSNFVIEDVPVVIVDISLTNL